MASNKLEHFHHWQHWATPQATTPPPPNPAVACCGFEIHAGSRSGSRGLQRDGGRELVYKVWYLLHSATSQVRRKQAEMFDTISHLIPVWIVPGYYSCCCSLCWRIFPHIRCVCSCLLVPSFLFSAICSTSSTSPLSSPMPTRAILSFFTANQLGPRFGPGTPGLVPKTVRDVNSFDEQIQQGWPFCEIQIVQCLLSHAVSGAKLLDLLSRM